MALSASEISKIRLQLLAARCRVLWLNLRYGWTTKVQQNDAMMDGQVAVLSAGHWPENPHTHPVLKEAFDDGVYCGQWDFEQEGEDRYREQMSATYDAIQRDENSDIYDECRELGLVGESGTRSN